MEINCYIVLKTYSERHFNMVMMLYQASCKLHCILRVNASEFQFRLFYGMEKITIGWWYRSFNGLFNNVFIDSSIEDLSRRKLDIYLQPY